MSDVMTVHVQYEDEVMTLSEFCRKLGLDYKMSRLIIQNDCVFSGEYIEKILQKKNKSPPIVKPDSISKKGAERFAPNIFRKEART